MASGRWGTAIGLGLWTAVGPVAAAPDACLPVRSETVWVERVIDGDEVALTDGRRVRLAGTAVARVPLAARGGTWAAAGREASAAAKQRLEALVEGVELSFHELGEDRHGRRRGHLVATQSGQWIEAALLTAGAVRAGVSGGRTPCRRALLAAEATARAARRGVWASGLLGVRAVGDPTLSEMVGAEVVVEGEVRSVGRSGGRTYLNFGDDFRRDFALVLDDNHRGALVASGFEVERARNRAVRVRGLLLRREGLRIELAAPEDIEWAKR